MLLRGRELKQSVSATDPNLLRPLLIGWNLSRRANQGVARDAVAKERWFQFNGSARCRGIENIDKLSLRETNYIIESY